MTPATLTAPEPEARSAVLPASLRRLKVMFVVTSMPVGGAETLLVNLMRRLDAERFAPELCCLKEPGPLGAELAAEFPVHSELLVNRWDFTVLFRLTTLMLEREIDAVVTVGAGDKMFWGRLAAWRADVPVIASAIHSTGWPDNIGWLNRLLTPLNDAFIAVADRHAAFLVHEEGFPAERVQVVPNGVDTDRFQRRSEDRTRIRRELSLPAGAPVLGTVAALRPEKNHRLMLEVAARVFNHREDAALVLVGDGPERAGLESYAAELGVAERVRFVGSRQDVPALLSAMDLFLLTSLNEANPVSILEALACECPVVSTDVGSIAETVIAGETGFLAPSGDAAGLAELALRLFDSPSLAAELGANGRRHVVADWSLAAMVRGYEELLAGIHAEKTTVAAAE